MCRTKKSDTLFNSVNLNDIIIGESIVDEVIDDSTKDRITIIIKDKIDGVITTKVHRYDYNSDVYTSVLNHYTKGCYLLISIATNNTIQVWNNTNDTQTVIIILGEDAEYAMIEGLWHKDYEVSCKGNVIDADPTVLNTNEVITN